MSIGQHCSLRIAAVGAVSDELTKQIFALHAKIEKRNNGGMPTASVFASEEGQPSVRRFGDL